MQFLIINLHKSWIKDRFYPILMKVYDQKLYFSSWFWNPISLKVVPFDPPWKIDLIYVPIEFLEWSFLIRNKIDQKK